MRDINKILGLERELRRIKEDLEAGTITEKKAEKRRQLTKTLLDLEKAGRVSEETLSRRITI
jgi:ribosomal protein RSM22 (predicted rRNA methylase)